MIEGILPINKPQGWTSHDVVAKVRRIIGMKRIGHTGTLDPQVTGVLPLCLGKATRVVEYIQELPKEYEVKMIIGFATDTEDLSGTIIEKVNEVELVPEQISQMLLSFEGELEQIPPMYSAVKVDGKKLYELARQGIEIERKSRTVFIHNIQIHHMDCSKNFPEIHFSVQCSKGTYVRTLCTDIGRALGYPAVMSELTRTSTGLIHLNQCITIEEVEALQEKNMLHTKLIPTDQAISFMPAYFIPAIIAKDAKQGKKISLDDLIQSLSKENKNQPLRLYSEEQQFIGIYKVDLEQNVLVPKKIFIT